MQYKGNTEKQEKKIYTKNKVIDFFKNTFFDDYKVKMNTYHNNKRTSINNCITGYRLITEIDSDIEEQQFIKYLSKK